MKVLYIWDAEYPWDVRTQKICATLTEHGDQVRILARNRRREVLLEKRPEGVVQRMEPLRVLPPRLDAWSSFPAFFNPRWIRHVSRSIRDFGPDVLIVRDLPLCPTAIRAARLASLPLILDMAENYPAMMQDIWDDGRQKWFDALVRNPALGRIVEKYCLARVDRVLVVVEESAARLRRLGVPEHALSLVSNTPSVCRVTTAPLQTRPPRRLEIVYLGLMEIARGVGDLIDAAAQLRLDGLKLRVTLIGDGRDRTIFQERAARMKLDDEVRFLGYVRNSEALELLAESHVGVIPHRASEAWNTTVPNKLFDYMAAGLGVISSNAIPAARIVTETGTGLVYQAGDASALADRIRTIGDDALREQFGTAGRAWIRTHYNWEADASRLIQAVECAAGRPSSASREHVTRQSVGIR